MNNASEKRQPASQLAIFLRGLWVGRGKPAIRWRSLFSAGIAMMLIGLLYSVGLSFLRAPAPLKQIGWVILVLAVGAIIWFFRSALVFLLQLGVKRLFLLLGTLYLAAVLIAGMLVPTGATGLAHWLTSAGSVAGWAADGPAALGRAIARTPEDLLATVTGERPPRRLPGVEWVGDMPPTPIPVKLVPVNAAEPASVIPPEEQAEPSPQPQSRALQVGDTVRVIGTEGAALRARSEPSTSAQIVARFSPGSVLRITDGSQAADGRTWWRVKSEQGEGWCAAEFLTLVE